MTADLLLGSDIGRWILNEVRPSEVGVVITSDSRLARDAKTAGFAVSDTPAARSRVAVSAHFPVVLAQAQLSLWDRAYNLHPGFLPYGRGYAPVFWALWAGEPAGATLHEMSATLDGGPIVDQMRVLVGPRDTGETLYQRVYAARRTLFSKWWPRLTAGEHPLAREQPEGGSYHSRAEFIRLRDAPSIESMSAMDLVRLVRALARPGYLGPRVQGGRLGLK